MSKMTRFSVETKEGWVRAGIKKYINILIYIKI